jgi:hypothetical protein
LGSGLGLLLAAALALGAAGPEPRCRERSRRVCGADIALYSWRLAEFVDHGPAVPSNGMLEPFDLIAYGGPDNVWIVECGRAADWGGSFTAFQDAIRAASVLVTPVTEGLPASAVPPFFEVEYQSPCLGTVSFGWEGPLVVAGEEVPIGGYPRYENPWTRAEFLDRNLLLHDAETGSSLWQDFETGTGWE